MDLWEKCLDCALLGPSRTSPLTDSLWTSCLYDKFPEYYYIAEMKSTKRHVGDHSLSNIALGASPNVDLVYNTPCHTGVRYVGKIVESTDQQILYQQL